MAAKTLLRSGASLVTRLINPNFTHKTLISSSSPSNISSKVFVSPLLSNSQSFLFSPKINGVSSDFFSSNDSTSSSFFNGNEKMIEQKRLEIAKILNPCGQPSLEFFLPDADESSSDPMILFPKRPFQPSTLRRKRNHGFFARKATKGGWRVIARRIAKGRHRVTA